MTVRAVLAAVGEGAQRVADEASTLSTLATTLAMVFLR